MNTPDTPSTPFDNAPVTWANADPGPLGFCYQCVLEALAPQPANGRATPVVPRRAVVMIGRIHRETDPVTRQQLQAVIPAGICVPHLVPARQSRLALS